MSLKLVELETDCPLTFSLMTDVSMVTFGECVTDPTYSPHTPVA